MQQLSVGILVRVDPAQAAKFRVDEGDEPGGITSLRSSLSDATIARPHLDIVHDSPQKLNP